MDDVIIINSRNMLFHNKVIGYLNEQGTRIVDYPITGGKAVTRSEAIDALHSAIKSFGNKGKDNA